MRTILVSTKALSLFSVLALLLFASTASGFGGPKAKPSKVGIITDSQLLHAGCHFTVSPCFGDGSNAGAIITAKVKFRGKGWPRWVNYKKSSITSSTSWDWSSFNLTNHPCALVNVAPRTIKEFGTNGGATFETDATIIIEVPYKGTIYGKVRGGSVCELHDTGGYTGVNEGMTAFEVDPEQSTGKFYGATGTGSIRSAANQTTGEFVFNEVYLNLNKAKKY